MTCSSKALLHFRFGRQVSLAPCCAILAAGCFYLSEVVSQAQPRVVTESVSISQKRLLLQGSNAGGYSLRKVLESGGHFFSTPYVPDDGMGEGANGPKAAQRREFYPGAENFPVLKMNGLGANSCFDCHNSIGSYVMAGYESEALMRKPQAAGGAGGLAANLFQNPDFPDQLVKFYRNPPHVFGTGYSQRLAAEITHDLLLAKGAAEMAAELNPGAKQSIPLSSKGNDYGIYSTTYLPSEGRFSEDISGVAGVPADLVVRPFQHKGIPSSLRHFVMSALDFHFSVQPVEVVGYNVDKDQDGKFNEMSPDLSRGPDSADPSSEPATDYSFGNVSALTAYVGMTRPPEVEIPAGMEDSVARGKALFAGEGLVNMPAGAAGMCASCHRPSMRIELPIFTIDGPQLQGDLSYRSEAGLGNRTVPDTESLPVVQAFQEALAAYKNHPAVLDAMNNPQNAAEDFYALLQDVQEDLDRAFLPAGYHIHLTLPGILNGHATRPDLPSYVYPRLEANEDGTVDVPFYSDLKLHDMGVGLMDVEDQEVDVMGVFVEKRLFLTRPLWGVADTGPWLHDGRAFDLNTAILYHKSEGSEANPVIEVYESLADEQKEDLLNFLLSMRLSIPLGVSETSQLPEWAAGVQIHSIRFLDGKPVIEFKGALKSSPEVTGPYSEVQGATSPYSVDTEDSKRFFQVE